VRRSTRLRYAGGTPGLYAATGATWTPVEGVGQNVTAISQLAGDDTNDILVGSSAGTLWRVQETTVLKTVELGHAVFDMTRDPGLAGLVLIGTANGLYKTLDNLEHIGQMAFDGQAVPQVDVMRAPGSGGACIIVCAGGGLSVGGVWLYQNGTWLYRSNGLPAGWDWFIVVADPYDTARWAVLGNTPGQGGYDYSNGRVVVRGMDLSPVWYTTDAGLTWQEVPLNTRSHVGMHACQYGGEWPGFAIDDMEFDRTANKNLFIFGQGGEAPRRAHGAIWYGPLPEMNFRLIKSSATVEYAVHDGSYSTSDMNTIVSGEGGPDGGTVFIATTAGGFFNTELVPKLIYTTPGDDIAHLNPGMPVIFSGTGGVSLSVTSERRPVFNSHEIAALIQIGSGAVKIYTTDNYKKHNLAYKQDLPNRTGLCMTWAIDGLYVGGGYGIQYLPDPTSQTVIATYRDDLVFDAVRCDRQWRRSLAGLVPADKAIHVRMSDGVTAEWTIIPYPTPNFSTTPGLEVLGL
jgi:hypothetical protein